MAWHQVNVAFPEPLYQEFVHLVPAGQRTKFLTHLAETGLQRLRLELALSKTFGAWSKHSHAELKRGTGPCIRRLRRSRRPRA